MANKGSYSIGIDLGGSRVKFVRIDGGGNILEKKACPIVDTEDSWVSAIKGLVQESVDLRGEPPRYIGLAAPGLAAKDGSAIACMPGRLAGIEGLNWTKVIDCGVDVPVLNDAQAALRGEQWQGAGRGVDNAFMLTLGTGVGGAVLIDGKVRSGNIGRLGHLGHITLDASGELDATKTPGSLEDAVGDKTIKLRSTLKYETTKDLVTDVKGGDEGAKKIWLAALRNLAAGICSLINVLDPEIVILGGGIISAGEEFFTPLQKYIGEYEWQPGGHTVKIVPAELGDYAGAIGAVKYAIDRSGVGWQ
jgi:glucokinase